MSLISEAIRFCHVLLSARCRWKKSEEFFALNLPKWGPSSLVTQLYFCKMRCKCSHFNSLIYSWASQKRGRNANEPLWLCPWPGRSHKQARLTEGINSFITLPDSMGCTWQLALPVWMLMSSYWAVCNSVGMCSAGECQSFLLHSLVYYVLLFFFFFLQGEHWWTLLFCMLLLLFSIPTLFRK